MHSKKAAELWKRLREFEFPGGFAERLAKEQSWSLDYATRAIEEYRRYMYLLMAAGHRVSPSQVVDEVWHLHLIYTHSYWDELCDQVLRFRAHHNPGTGEPGDEERFAGQYQRTKDSYDRFFGKHPCDIWCVSLQDSREPKLQTVLY